MKLLTLTVFLLISNVVYSNSVHGVEIIKLAINPAYGNYVLIKLDQPPERISCSENGSWDFTLSLTSDVYKHMYSLLLSAFMAGKKIDINGTNSCNEFPHIESVNTLHVNT
ncbi:hypothetical protein [Agaribacterium haliotis]|uniref:hypothetical protein n=1 Tax=Agaribacterium haliotis TaxID=2013869 RepID=UPI000BB57CEE|nr:hypothetical protein [Agaribacterium haliotis]